MLKDCIPFISFACPKEANPKKNIGFGDRFWNVECSVWGGASDYFIKQSAIINSWRNMHSIKAILLRLSFPCVSIF